MKAIFLVVFALSAPLCQKQEAAERPHPGCPGESSRSADDPNTCSCREGEVLWAGSLECKDCDPSRSQGLYCDCGKDRIFSFDPSLDDQLSLRSAQVQCDAPADCPAGQFLDGAECADCGDLQCGETCGPCAVGETCVSGLCVPAAVCRIEIVHPAEGKTEDDCRFRVDEVCGLGLRNTLPAGLPCECDGNDRNCWYEGLSEALSK